TKKLVRKKYFNTYADFYHTFYEMRFIYEINTKSFMPPPTVKSALVKVGKKNCTDNYGVVVMEEYISFIHFMMMYPVLPSKTVLKKLFRKQQVRELAESYGLALDKPVCSMSAEQFLGCFVSMLTLVPIDYHPNLL